MTSDGQDRSSQKLPPVIWFSIFDWWTHSHGHSDFQLALAIARQRPVLLVNSVGVRIPTPGKTSRLGRRVCRKFGSLLRGLRYPVSDLPRFAVFTPFGLPISKGPLGKCITSLTTYQVHQALRRHGISEPIGIVTTPTAYPVARRLHLRGTVYNRSDDHSAYAESGGTVADLEEKMLKECDLVAYSSSHLMEREKARVGPRALYLEHGVDPNLFRIETAPDREIAALPHPRIGFCGSLRAHALDIELLERIADHLGDIALILVGDRSDKISALLRRRNVRWFPPRPHAMMPSCWSALDIGIMPYLTGRWGHGIDPIKLREMLAMGLTIVSTEIPAAVARAPAVNVAKDAAHFIELLLDSAQRLSAGASRQCLYASPSWATQAQILMERADNV